MNPEVGSLWRRKLSGRLWRVNTVADGLVRATLEHGRTDCTATEKAAETEMFTLDAFLSFMFAVPVPSGIRRWSRKRRLHWKRRATRAFLRRHMPKKTMLFKSKPVLGLLFRPEPFIVPVIFRRELYRGLCDGD